MRYLYLILAVVFIAIASLNSFAPFFFEGMEAIAAAKQLKGDYSMARMEMSFFHNIGDLSFWMGLIFSMFFGLTFLSDKTKKTNK